MDRQFGDTEKVLEDFKNFTGGFRPIRRVSATEFSNQQLDEFILEHEQNGLPLIIRDLHKSRNWPAHILIRSWILENCLEEMVTARDVWSRKDIRMSVKDYLEYVETAPKRPSAEETYRLYGKDAPCPPAWREWLHSGFFPDRLVPCNQHDLFRYLLDKERPETLMTYFGIDGTYTPFHKDHCASQGSNIMTYADPDASSLWWMTSTADSLKLSAHFTRTYETELDWEYAAFDSAEIAKWPCEVYFGEQTLGDLVLVPRRSAHQVLNKGGLTVKMSWSRMTENSVLEGVRLEVPIYHRVCRLEVYRTRLICYRVIRHLLDEITTAGQRKASLPNEAEATHLLDNLTPLFDEILQAEWEPDHSAIPVDDPSSPDLVCDFCGADIFQSFFECSECRDPESTDDPTYILCAACYTEGRSCKCRTMTPKLRRPFVNLLNIRNQATERLVPQDNTIFTIANAYARIPSNRLFRGAMALWRERTGRDRDIAKQHKARVAEGEAKRRRPITHEEIESVYREISAKVEANRGCNLPPEKGGPHRTTIDNWAKCRPAGGCGRAFCHFHSLELRRSHASDDILDVGDHIRYHSKHVNSRNPQRPSRKDEFNNIFGSRYPSAIRNPEPYPDIDIKAGYRLIWFALTFRRCRPERTGRSVLGWYDKKDTSDSEDELDSGTHANDVDNDAHSRASSPELPLRRGVSSFSEVMEVQEDTASGFRSPSVANPPPADNRQSAPVANPQPTSAPYYSPRKRQRISSPDPLDTRRPWIVTPSSIPPQTFPTPPPRTNGLFHPSPPPGPSKLRPKSSETFPPETKPPHSPTRISRPAVIQAYSRLYRLLKSEAAPKSSTWLTEADDVLEEFANVVKIQTLEVSTAVEMACNPTTPMKHEREDEPMGTWPM